MPDFLIVGQLCKTDISDIDILHIDNNLKSKLVMQVHDELIVETADNELEIVEKLMREAMENIVKLDIPLDIDLNVGKSWYDAK